MIGKKLKKTWYFQGIQELLLFLGMYGEIKYFIYIILLITLIGMKTEVLIFTHYL